MCWGCRDILNLSNFFSHCCFLLTYPPGLKHSIGKANELREGTLMDCPESHSNESDAVILRALESMQDHIFCERFMLPPEKVIFVSSHKPLLWKGFRSCILIYFSSIICMSRFWNCAIYQRLATGCQCILVVGTWRCDSKLLSWVVSNTLNKQPSD